MNKKPLRTGPKIRVTKLANRLQRPDDLSITQSKLLDDHKLIYTCQYCRQKFTQNSQFFRHMTTNHETQQKQATFQCNECKIVFGKKTELNSHCRTNHLVKSKSTCEGCSITFKSRYCLRRHLKLKKLLIDNTCGKCLKQFTNEERLANHVRKHTNKNVTYECDLCLLKFKAKESLHSHLTRNHQQL